MRGCTCTGPLLCPTCHALAVRAGVLGPAAVPISEKSFQAAVIRVAKQEGWLVHWTFDSRRSPSGYPDLTLVHPARHIALCCELKVPGGVLTLAQQRWLTVLGQVERVEAHVWFPDDMPSIRALLAGKG